MKKLLDFKGRATRWEFWLIHLCAVLFLFIILNLYLFTFLYWLFFVIALIAIISVTVRRFHDLGKPGSTYFYFIIPNFVALFIRIYIPQLIPLAAILVFGTSICYVIYLSQKSQEKYNQYGPNPNNEKNKIK